MQYTVKQLKPRLHKHLIKHRLNKKWDKVKYLLESNLSHPSLNLKKIVFKSTAFYSFKLDKKYRGICILAGDVIEVILFTNHYK